MLRIVAEYGDRWNSNVPVAEMAERNRILDEQCAAVGRDPATILRSHLYVPAVLPDERPWASIEAFRDFAGRLQDAGVREVILQPPPDDEDAIVERIAGEVLPTLGAAKTV